MGLDPASVAAYEIARRDSRYFPEPSSRSSSSTFCFSWWFSVCSALTVCSSARTYSSWSGALVIARAPLDP